MTIRQILILLVATLSFATEPAAAEKLIRDTVEKMKGEKEVELVKIGPRGGIQLTGDLTITATGDIVIEGDISPAKGSKNTKLTLTSENGNIIIGGNISTKNGINGDPDNGGLTVNGGSGEFGDSVTIAALTGSIEIRGNITTGDGGNGGDADSGIQDYDNQVSATSGAGGNGGNITITATKELKIFGNLTSGNGGDSGRAEATNIAKPRNDKTPEASALARAGGSSGDITLESKESSVQIAPTSTIETGLGGDGGSAESKGYEAFATVSGGERSGNVTVKAPAGIKISGTILTGDAGDSALLRGATANGKNRAEAKVTMGGNAGARPEGANGKRGKGGDTGTSTATSKFGKAVTNGTKATSSEAAGSTSASSP